MFMFTYNMYTLFYVIKLIILYYYDFKKLRSACKRCVSHNVHNIPFIVIQRKTLLYYQVCISLYTRTLCHTRRTFLTYEGITVRYTHESITLYVQVYTLYRNVCIKPFLQSNILTNNKHKEVISKPVTVYNDLYYPG